MISRIGEWVKRLAMEAARKEIEKIPTIHKQCEKCGRMEFINNMKKVLYLEFTWAGDNKADCYYCKSHAPKYDKVWNFNQTTPPVYYKNCSNEMQVDKNGRPIKNDPKRRNTNNA